MPPSTLYLLLLTLITASRLFLACFYLIDQAVALAHRPATVMFQVQYLRIQLFMELLRGLASRVEQIPRI